jgi:hypothetical protein
MPMTVLVVELVFIFAEEVFPNMVIIFNFGTGHMTAGPTLAFQSGRYHTGASISDNANSILRSNR